MTEPRPDLDIEHTDAGLRATVDGHTAVLDLVVDGDRLVFTHTGVPAALEGRGVGSALVAAGVDHARATAKTIVPRCWFVRGWLDRHPDVAATVDIA